MLLASVEATLAYPASSAVEPAADVRIDCVTGLSGTCKRGAQLVVRRGSNEDVVESAHMVPGITVLSSSLTSCIKSNGPLELSLEMA